MSYENRKLNYQKTQSKQALIDCLTSEWIRSTNTSYFTINKYIYIYIHTHGTWLIEFQKEGPTCVHDLIESVDQLHVLLERD